MNSKELGELHDNINRAFDRLRLGKLATERVGWKPDGDTTPILPMLLEDAINITRNEVRGLLNAAIGREVRQ